MSNELHDAARDPSRNGFAQVLKLIKDGVDVNAKHTEYGTTAVAFAAQSGSLHTLRYLIEEAGARLDASNEERNLLHFALTNSPDVLEYVSSGESKLYEKFNDGTTDLHVAAAAGRVEEVRVILSQHPERIREKNKRGETPLYWAAAGEQEDVFKLILNHDAYKLLTIPEIDEDSRIVADIFNITANHYFDTNRKAQAIEAYRKAIYYRSGVADKKDDDYKSLSMYHSNLGGAFLYQFANENQGIAIHHAMKAYQDGRGAAEQIANQNDAVGQRLVTECRDGLISIQAVMQKQSTQQKKPSYRAALGNPADRYLPDEVVQGGASAYNAGGVDRVISGWSNEYRRGNNDAPFSFFSPGGFIAQKYSAYAAHRRAKEQERLQIAAVIEASRKAAEEEERRLRAEAEGHGFNVIIQKGDGNCAYHSIAHQLNIQNVPGWKGATHEQLRMIATNHIKNQHLEHYQEFIDMDDVDIKNMHQDQCWATHHSILALARELNVNIFILQSDGKKPVVIRREKSVDDKLPTLYLGYEVPRHYQSLAPVSGDFKPSELIQSFINAEHIDDFKMPAPKPVVLPVPNQPVINENSLALMQFAPAPVPVPVSVPDCQVVIEIKDDSDSSSPSPMQLSQ